MSSDRSLVTSIASDDAETRVGDQHPVSPGRHPAAATVTVSKPKRSQRPSPLSSKLQELPLWVPIAAGSVVVGLLARFILRATKKKSNKATVNRKQVFLEPIAAAASPSSPKEKDLAKPPSSGSSSIPSKLSGKTFVLSDRFNVAGIPTHFAGVTWLNADNNKPETSAAIVQRIQSLGAIAEATVPLQPLGLPITSNPNMPNPAAKDRVHGGGEFGAAVAASGGLCDFSLVVDELGCALASAACCGVYACRPTRGVLPTDGVILTTPTLASVGFMSESCTTLLDVAKGLNLPGSFRTDTVASYLIAEDLFTACDDDVQAVVPAIVQAVKRWAGTEQAKGLSLCEWMYHRFATLQEFYDSSILEAEVADTPVLTNQQRADAVLQAMAQAAHAIHTYEVRHKLIDARVDTANLPPPNELDIYTLGVLETEAVEEKVYQAALAVAKEIREGLRGALQEGYIFVLPTIPGAPPKASSASIEDLNLYQQRCMQLAALSSLAGAPQVAIPVARKNQPPVSVSLLALPRSDMSLIQAASKLGVLLAQEINTLDGGADNSSSGSSHRQGAEQDHAKLNKEAADLAKEEGNAAFKAANYKEAVRWYSEAIRLNPSSDVYYSNRALMYLKLGSYTAAEADADAALQLDSKNVKALLRRGSARSAQGNVQASLEDFKAVLVLEPRNRQALEELNKMKAFEDSSTSAAAGF